MKPYYSDDWVTIYHGDCREVLPNVHGELTLSSPPYVDQRDYGNVGFPKDKAAWTEWLCDVLELCLTASKSAVFNLGDRRRDGYREWDAADFYSAARSRGCRLWERFIWAKEPFGPNGSERQPDDPLETCLWFGMPAFRMDEVRRRYAASTIPRYANATTIRWEKNGTQRRKGIQRASELGARATTLLVFPCLPTEEFVGHPAQFPLSLPKWFIKAATIPGDTLIEPFMGSGTTLRAAKDSERKAIGMDTVEAYCELAANRMSQDVLALDNSEQLT